MLANHRPDLVLCDITMPGLGGYDVLKAMREKGGLADVPFIFLTALADRNDVLVGKQAGADDYLVKPIDYEILLATVAARLNQVARVPDERGRAGRGGMAGSSQVLPRADRGGSLQGDFRVRPLPCRRGASSTSVGTVRLMNKEAERILAEGRWLGVVAGISEGRCSRSRTPSCTKA